MFYKNVNVQGFRVELRGFIGEDDTGFLSTLQTSWVFENYNESISEYSAVSYGFDLFGLLPIGYCKRAMSILWGACNDYKK